VLEYRDPYLIKDINTLAGIQRRASRFVIQNHSRLTSVSSLLMDLNWGPLKDRRRYIRLAMLFKIVKCNMPEQADAILLLADHRTWHHHSFEFKHILSHTAQYKHSFFVRTVPETLFRKPASTRIPLHIPMQLRHTPWAVCTPHRRDTWKWSDDYWTRTKTSYHSN